MPGQNNAIVSWAQVVATIFLGLVGVYFTKTQSTQQEENRMVQARTTLITQRDQFEMDFKQKMFPTLIDKLLNRSIPVRERLAVLKLFEHNFHDIFNGRALFDVLEEDANKLPPQERDDIINHLDSFAREIGEAEEQLVSSSLQLIEMKEGDSTSVSLFQAEKSSHPEEHEASSEPGHRHRINIKLNQVRRDAVDLEVEIDSGTPQSTKRHFVVKYFDAPLTDNTLLPDKHRFAITLKDTDIDIHPHKATLHIFEFAEDYVPSGYRLSKREADKLLKSNQE